MLFLFSVKLIYQRDDQKSEQSLEHKLLDSCADQGGVQL